MRLTALPISGRLQAPPAVMVYGTPAISSGNSGICSARMKAGGLWRLRGSPYFLALYAIAAICVHSQAAFIAVSSNAFSAFP